MSDETRTVTVESLAAALREVDVLEGYPWEDQRPEGWRHRKLATDLFAALPVATAGPEPDGEPDWLHALVLHAEAVHGCTHTAQLREDAHIPTFAAAALRGAAAQADGGEAGPTIDPLRNVRQHPYRVGGTFELRVMEHGSSILFPPHIVYIDRDEQDRRVTTFVAEVHENAIAHARALAAQADTAPGLDVERLREAFWEANKSNLWGEAVDFTDLHANQVAAEYERLTAAARLADQP